jgi:hypothetical protein
VAPRNTKIDDGEEIPNDELTTKTKERRMLLIADL